MNAGRIARAVRKRIGRRYVRLLWNRFLAPCLGRVPMPLRVPLFAVELTSRCNLRCRMCPHPALKRQKADMDWNLYTHIIDALAEYGASDLELQRFGESLLYPRLGEAIRYAKARGVGPLRIITNGMLLTPKKTDELLDSGLDQMRFSLDTLDKAEYEEIRQGGRLDQTVGNLDHFLKERARRGLRKPEIWINCVVINEQMDQIRRLWDRYGNQVDCINMRPVIQYGEGQDLRRFTGLPRGQTRPCMDLWRRMNFLQDGRVTLCCGDVEGELAVGDIRETSVRDLWHRAVRTRELRRLHHARKFASLPVCQRCDGIDSDAYERAFAQKARIQEEAARAGVSQIVRFSL